jgi:hypothetical protein
MRSTLSKENVSRLKVPAKFAGIGLPFNTTKVWSLFIPRRKSPVTEPAVPRSAIVNPGTSLSASVIILC